MNYENKLYNDTVTINYNGAKHTYIWHEKDVVVKSVTTALRIINKPQLIPWAARITVETIAEAIQPGIEYDEVELANLWELAKKAHYQKKETAGSLGTLLHKWIEQYIKGENPGMPKNKGLRESVDKFLKWKKEHKVKFLLSEQVVFSKEFMYCGTLDFICEVDGQLYIGDLKTSTGVYAEMLVQTAAYRHAREEEFPKEKYAGMLILRIGSDGTFETAIIRGNKIYHTLISAFVYALGLSNFMAEIEGYRPERNI